MDVDISLIKNILIPILNRFSSFPRMRESRQPLKNWIPAFAGMTNSVVFDLKKIKLIGKRYNQELAGSYIHLRNTIPQVLRLQQIS